VGFDSIGEGDYEGIVMVLSEEEEIKRKESMVVVPKDPIDSVCPLCKEHKLYVLEGWDKSGCNHPVDTVHRAMFVCTRCNVRYNMIYPHIDLDKYKEFYG